MHNVPLIFGSNEIAPKYVHSKAHLLFALPEMGLWSYKEKVGRFNQHLDFFGITNYSSSSKSFCCLQFFDAQLSSAIEIYRIPAWLQLFPMQSGSISTILLPECMSANYCEVFIDVHRFESNSRISKSSNHFQIARLCAERNCFCTGAL